MRPAGDTPGGDMHERVDRAIEQINEMIVMVQGMTESVREMRIQEALRRAGLEAPAHTPRVRQGRCPKED